jgi:hypothetical protein
VARGESTEFSERPVARGLRLQFQGDGLWAIWVDEPELLELGWGFLAGLAAEIFGGKDLLVALAAELGKWRELVARMPTTTTTAAIGILGELAVFRAALDNGHEAPCWVGRDGGPIDFRFGATECEVKTTLGLRHEHVVNGADQMQPSPGVQLYLLSLRIAPTETGTGSSVAGLFDELSERTANRHELEDSLRRRGVELFDPAATAEYILRSAPLLIDASTLPTITTGMLVAELGSGAARVSDLSYRLNVDGMPATDDQVCRPIAESTVL